MVFYGNKYHYADALLSLSDVGLINNDYFVVYRHFFQLLCISCFTVPADDEINYYLLFIIQFTVHR